MPRQINTIQCSGCSACISACPVEAIKLSNNIIQIDPNECVDCATCWRICPEQCIDGAPDKYLELRNG
jgi:ferredoxin